MNMKREGGRIILQSDDQTVLDAAMEVIRDNFTLSDDPEDTQFLGGQGSPGPYGDPATYWRQRREQALRGKR